MRMQKLLALLLVLACGVVRAEPAADASRLFAFAYRDLQGKPASVANLRGKPLIVNFWARWCAPCREEMPELETFHAKHRNKVTVLGLAVEDDAEGVRRFRERYTISYPMYLTGDQGLALMQALGNSRGGLPYTVYIDTAGRIVGSRMGRLKPGDLDAALGQLSR